MCSTKWEMPLVSAGSQREPDLIHTPIATERRYSMRSVRTIRPFGNTVRRRFLSGLFIIDSNSIVGQMGSKGTFPAVSQLIRHSGRRRKFDKAQEFWNSNSGQSQVVCFGR